MSAGRLAPIVLCVCAGAAAPTGAAATPKAEIRVQPASIQAGDRVRVFGLAEDCRGAVTLISRAFARRHEFAGVPAITATVGPDGRFSRRTRIPGRRRPGRYTITGRCGGGNLGVTARLRVLAHGG